MFYSNFGVYILIEILKMSYCAGMMLDGFASLYHYPAYIIPS